MKIRLHYLDDKTKIYFDKLPVTLTKSLNDNGDFGEVIGYCEICYSELKCYGELTLEKEYTLDKSTYLSYNGYEEEQEGIYKLIRLVLSDIALKDKNSFLLSSAISD